MTTATILERTKNAHDRQGRPAGVDDASFAPVLAELRTKLARAAAGTPGRR
jgi:hypothetical protein